MSMTPISLVFLAGLVTAITRVTAITPQNEDKPGVKPEIMGHMQHKASQVQMEDKHAGNVKGPGNPPAEYAIDHKATEQVAHGEKKAEGHGNGAVKSSANAAGHGQDQGTVVDKSTVAKAAKRYNVWEGEMEPPSRSTVILLGAALLITIIFAACAVFSMKHKWQDKGRGLIGGSGLSTSSSDITSSETGSTDRELKSRMERFEQRLEHHKKRIEAETSEGSSSCDSKMRNARMVQKK